MKVKKFKNLWTIGLIIWGSILGIFYLIKLIFPEFVVGVAQLDSIVKVGEYIDTHKWAYLLFTFFTSLFVYYFYCCACCRKKNLNLKELAVITLGNIVMILITEFLPQYFVSFNDISLFVLPMIICFMNKYEHIKYYYSTAITFSLYTFSQFFSLEIRGISTLISYPNTATYTILLVDVYIWALLLYNYFNFKEKN